MANCQLAVIVGSLRKESFNHQLRDILAAVQPLAVAFMPAVMMLFVVRTLASSLKKFL